MSHVHGSIHNPELRQILRAEGLHQIAFMPIAADNDWFKTATNPVGTTGGETVTITSFTKAYCPGWPVVPTITYTPASGSEVGASGSGTSITATVMGEDQFGDVVTETVDCSDGSGVCVNAYQKLISVSLSIVGTALATDAIIVGFAKTYGLGRKIAASGDVIAKLFDGAADAGTVDANYSTYAVAGTPNAAKNLIILLRPGYYTHV